MCMSVSYCTYDFNIWSTSWENRWIEDLIDIHNKVPKLEISQTILVLIGRVCPQYLLYLLPGDLTIEHKVKEYLCSLSFAGAINIYQEYTL